MFFKFHNKCFELISGLTSNSYDILNCMIESLQDLDLIRFHFSQKDTNVKNIQQPENTRVSTCLFSLKRQSIYFHVKVFTVPKSLSLSLFFGVRPHFMVFLSNGISFIPSIQWIDKLPCLFMFHSFIQFHAIKSIFYLAFLVLHQNGIKQRSRLDVLM